MPAAIQEQVCEGTHVRDQPRVRPYKSILRGGGELEDNVDLSASFGEQGHLWLGDLQGEG